MTRLTKLTPEQEARFAEFRDKWRAIEFCTDPADRPRAEKAVIEVYKAAGLPPPRNIVWCGSPLSQAITEAIFLLDENFSASIGNPAVCLYSYQAGLRASVRNAVWDKVSASVGGTGRMEDSVWFAVENGIRDSVMDDLSGDSLRYSLRCSFVDLRTHFENTLAKTNWYRVRWRFIHPLLARRYGQPDASWISVYDYFRAVCGFVEETEKLLALMELCKSAGWCLPYRHVCWISERHNFLARDERGRLHNLAGPAITYPDGWKIYAVHGVQVPAWVIENPETITVELIDSESNVDVRRVMIDQYGMQRYLMDSGAQITHQDTFGILYRKLVYNEEPIVMVKVRNSTPEPDGSVKDYFLRVPPEIETARAAVAWTFGLGEKQYSPAIET